MLEYDRIDLSEGVDVKESNTHSRECSFCNFWYFIDQNFNYQFYLCDGCHDMSMKAISMRDLVIIYSGGNAYQVNFTFMTLIEARNLFKNSSITNKKGLLGFLCNI